jgi:hypothetical protein
MANASIVVKKVKVVREEDRRRIQLDLSENEANALRVIVSRFTGSHDNSLRGLFSNIYRALENVGIYDAPAGWSNSLSFGVRERDPNTDKNIHCDRIPGLVVKEEEEEIDG